MGTQHKQSIHRDTSCTIHTNSLHVICVRRAVLSNKQPSGNPSSKYESTFFTTTSAGPATNPAGGAFLPVSQLGDGTFGVDTTALEEWVVARVFVSQREVMLLCELWYSIRHLQHALLVSFFKRIRMQNSTNYMPVSLCS